METSQDRTEVFEYLTAVEHMDSWVSGVTGIELASGGPGEQGAQYECDYTTGGRTSPMTLLLKSVKQPEYIEIEAIEGPFSFATTLALGRSPGGTRVTQTATVGADSRATDLMFRYLPQLVRWLFRRQLAADLGSLKSNLESQARDLSPESQVAATDNR